ncbi:pyrroloquinoline quinone biosynthesis protein PqqF [Pseudomonas vancouverensis]|uniref:Coenzyme PQQ synthesis protein F n=1 Tax=Pseudomonas vancouverensis TaxID=95300 RepID=A0A1H2PGA3_PSEVA|nr:pyrroloquinoline quinone biosynthesis protein PqqF [Pseudomonas vancouverensis]KAB0497438.1 pyrroloquinoline quinone biosynthesis protein PqqF [Pseudomonas vancouverensis]TDB66165.1 pyrroloquinoline quinone biosynthesis protein PqqF [Pseudomonas vancouverensis]SDV16704.1 pyrroloquinoline quinone synthesis related protease (pqqF). Metallo peptidase. MEROPS family M16A [Pseudomonas vancouverensis]
MPALNHPRPLTETLANGLRVTLRHAPNLKRCAAALRVAVGSHDVPLAWPGLAHFLEHLLFLGTERFPDSEGLMAYVQRHGGQLNARTSERTTAYFFELPAQAFAGGLQRLSDMLAHPRMNTDDQLREREVLQAEFVAWSQDAQAQQQQTLFNGLSDAHSLRGFHAGNRDSLPVEQVEFQQALRDFYQRFYQTGQMTLSLVGPQSIDELRTLAETFAGAIAEGEVVPQQAPTPLMNTPQKSYQQAGERRLGLLFALEDLLESSTEALAFLCHWLNSAKPGSLLADLREQGLADNLKAQPLYQFAGQALLHLEFTLPANPASTGIAERLADWLGFFAQQDWKRLREEYATLLQRQQHVSGALQLARLDSEQRENGLSEQGVIALKHIFTQIGAVDNFTGTWQLPSPNPFLRTEASAANAGLIRGQTSAHRGLRTFAQDRSRSRRERSPMQFSQALPDTADEGAVYVRWRLAFAPGAHLQAALEHSLQPLREDALQAGVEMAFSASANEWLLTLTGLQEPMPRVLEHALKALTTVDSTFLQAPATAPALIPIRQLLKVLPDRCIENAAESEDLQQLWSTAHWSGLAVGFSTQTQAAMGLALSRIPGTAQTDPAPVTSIPSQHWWTHIDTGASEHALLLFCPAPGPELADEAAWRLLAHVCQTPFYQRLRVELQLGYAVFSGLRQMHGQTGLLFGVQSPSTEPKALLQHIEQFLHALPDLINAMDDSTFNGRRQALAEQFSPATLSTTQAAELLWQSTLASRPSDYLTQLPTEILRIERAALLDSLERLTRADGGWRCLASSANPGMPWQASR